MIRIHWFLQKRAGFLMLNKVSKPHNLMFSFVQYFFAIIGTFLCSIALPYQRPIKHILDVGNKAILIDDLSGLLGSTLVLEFTLKLMIRV